MGIKDLWPFLNPYCERKPLFELQGKIVAIDLAGWICESLCVVDYNVQPKFYLRNLFFRTCYLILSGITPVFVLEGTAPALKHQTISQRNQIQFRGAKPRKNTAPSQSTQTQATQTNTQKANKGRTQFNYVLKQCEELIRSMGLQCVQGPGEAEAFCAHLNAHNLVDGVVSQDSDCFAYGARRVFRNFSLSMQGTAGSIGGSIDVYDLDFVQKSVDFGRNKIVVMALLCGCDYCPEGVGGVGRDAVQKLFAIYNENEILDKIRLWRKNDNKFTELEIKVDDKRICVNCGHNGRVQTHAKSGCGQCRVSSGCDASLWKEKRLALKSELQIRKKALQSDNFPSQEIIDEFFQKPIDMSNIQLDWSQPNVVKFVKMMGKLLQWEEIYCFQKFLPLLTRWQLHHAMDGSGNTVLRGSVQPDFIKKKRTPKGVPSYEIIWKDEQGCFAGIFSDDQLQAFYATSKEKNDTEALQTLWSTIEPMDLVENAYPELVQKFEDSKTKGKSKKTTKKAQEPTKSRTKKTAKENSQPIKKVTAPTNAQKPVENVQTLDKFFRKQKITPAVYASPKIKTTSKPLNLSAFSMNFDDSMIDDEDMNLSTIINEMVSRPANVTEFNGKKLKFDEITSKIEDRPRVESDVGAKEMSDEKENKVDVITIDDSLDEFDLMVMRKAKKSIIQRRKSIFEGSSSNVKPKLCSTPVSRNQHIASLHDLSNSFKQSPGLGSTPGNRKNSVISTSFFAVNPDDEIDLFEKSIDYRNMVDVDSDSDENDSPHESNASQQDLDDDDVNQYDTYDRLVGIS